MPKNDGITWDRVRLRVGLTDPGDGGLRWHAGAVVAALLLVMLLGPALVSSHAGTKRPAASPQAARDLQTLIKATAAKVIPAVVTIASTVVIREPGYLEEGLPFGLFPDPVPRRQHGQGSGVVVTDDGLIITNNHVVGETDEVQVILADRRQFKGRVVATDPKTDVAVVKIDAKGLPTIPWGDSAALSVGEFVLAIGNPMGLSQTVTFGIVSAVGRADVGLTDYEDFIQLDAPINPGNSGGALVSTRGELVGINTAIASTTGGSVGVGFAIPSNMVRATLRSLLKSGRVVRGFLGATTQDVTPVLGKLFKLPEVKGAIIADLMPQGSAQKAGLRRGDVIVRFDDREVLDAGQLRNLIAACTIGSTHHVEIVRAGRHAKVELVIQEAPRERLRRSEEVAAEEPLTHPLGGVLVDDIPFPVARRLGLGPRSGVMVVDVDPGSRAEAAGIIPGDLVLEVNGRPVSDLQSYQGIANDVRPAQAVLLLINRQGATLYLGIEAT